MAFLDLNRRYPWVDLAFGRRRQLGRPALLAGSTFGDRLHPVASSLAPLAVWECWTTKRVSNPSAGSEPFFLAGGSRPLQAGRRVGILGVYRLLVVVYVPKA